MKKIFKIGKKIKEASRLALMFALIISCTFIWIEKSFGQSLLIDDFTGTLGTNLTANGWTAHNGGGTSPLQIASPSLTYSGYASSGVGNATSVFGNGEDINKAFASTSSGTLYCSFMLNANPSGTTAAYPIHLATTSGATVTSFYARFNIQDDGSDNLRFGISKFTGAASYTGYSYSAGTTYFVVIKYTFNTGSTTDDVVEFFVNPTPGGTEPASTISVTETSTTDATALTSICLRQSSTTTPICAVDGIRVGTTWASVTPASSTPTLTVNPGTLTGFTYLQGSGPSAVQSFDLTGTNLDGSNVTLTPSTNYEISTSNSPFTATNPITLTSYNGASTTIYVRLKSGLTVGSYNSETITIAGGGDSDGASVTCSGSVTAPAPEMDVQGNATSIADGDGMPTTTDWTDFGSTDVTGGTIDRIFTIYNTGSGSLTLSGTPKIVIGGTNAADFSVSADATSPVAATTGSTTFTIHFNPSAAGTRSATLSIANDDSDENPYNFSIQGTGLGPEMDVNGNALTITDGDASPSTTDWTDFGATSISGGTIDKTYTIYNTGGGILTLSGTPKIVVGGTNAADFTVTSDATSPVAATTGSTTFTVRFDPSAIGTRSATLSIANNDSNENPYNFSIQGTGVYPEPTNNATGFACGTTTSSEITFTWVDAVAGSQAPEKYLILYNTTGTFTNPVDGTAQADGAGKVNIAYGVQTCTVTGLTYSTTYYFKIFPYTNSASNINYKVDGTVLTGSCITTTPSACGTQNFSGGTTAPAGWTYTAIGGTYTTQSCSGGTSLQMDNTNDAVETAPVTNPSEMSINIKGNGTDASSALLVEGWNGSSWTTIENIVPIPTTCTNKLFTSGLSSYTKFKYTYTKSAGNLSFDDVSITCAGGPTITTTTLTAFGNICTSSTSAEKTYTVSGTLLTDNIIITPPVVYEISTSSGSGFVANPSTLTLTQSGGTVNATTIYVRFKPTLVQSYNDNILHTSTGAVDKNVAVNGSGVDNLTPSITSPTSANLTSTTVDLGGNITAIGCANVTERGIYWSTTNGFADGTGTKVSETPGPYSTGTFTVAVSGLTANTVYYYKAFATSSIGTVYTSQGTFTTLCGNVTIPYSQGFNSTSIPSCWSSSIVTNAGGTTPTLTYIATSTNPTISAAAEGSHFVKFNSYNAENGDEMRLVSPPITTTGLSSINLDFDWFESPEYSTYLSEGLTVQYSLNGGTSWTDVQFYQRYNAVNGWKSKTCPLPAAINNQASVLIGFFFHSQYGNNCDFDDVYIYTCNEPTTNPLTMTFSNVTSTTIDLSIGTPGDGTNRIIVARAGSDVSFTPTDLTTYDATAVFSDATDLGSGNKVIYNGTGTSVSISGLSGATTYYFKVFEYNCITGYENYYTGGTILSGNTTTAISPVTNLKVVCQSNTTAQISWTSPTGSYDGVIIGMRNSTLVPHAISDDAANYTANAAFGSGTQYGGTTPYSFVVYKGTGTSITVTGLTLGQSYSIKAYAYKNNTGSIWSTTQPTTSISSLGTVNVTGNFVLTDNTQLQLQWSNPDASCFDEVMIIGNAGAAITTQPTGDGSAYSANTVFGSGDAYGSGYVVYKGGFSPQIITNLTNGTEYCFTWFVRNGTSWSSGVSACGTPATVTILEPGDLAIVAVNTQATSSGSADEICFFAFKDITEGTSIDFTDNGYERLYDGKWASSEGTLRWTRTGGGTITAGKVICFQGMGYQQSGFSIFTCGVADDANWTLTSLNSAGSSNGSYDLNVDDQIWIIQGGAWDNTGDLAAHNATYSGNVLYGWTATGWEPVSGYDDTKGSTLYPETECFNTNVAVAANHSKVKYIGATSTTSQFAWLGRINDNANWLGYATNAAYYAGPDYSGTCYEFISNSAIIGTPGVWTGNDNEDWFDCGNWQNLRIPSGSANVTASGAVSNHITIDDGITSMPEAECNNLTIAADATVGGAPLNLKVNNASSVLNVYGDFTNNKTVTHTNGEIHYTGDFVNNGTYTHNTAGTAIFDGSGNQELTGTATFFNMQMNNSSSGLTLNNDITVNNILTLTDGLINTGTNKVVIENNALGATTGQSTASYVNGNLRRKVATGSYDFPVGTATNYEIANINLVTSTITYLDAKFTSPHSGTTLPTSPYLTINGTDLTELLDYGFWTISPVAGTSTNYDVTLTSRGHSNGGSVATQHTIVKRADGSSAWTSYESNHNNATQSGTGSNPILAKLSGMSGFSDFAIARSATYPLPVSLIYFTADWSGDNVILNWETASESNNDYFLIERSNNGVEFEEIGSIKGIGNSSIVNSYSFIDYSPLNGKSYYRLKQVDFNEKYVFSNIVSIFKKESDKLSVSSNYNSEYGISFIINNPSKQLINLRILDMSGKIVYLDKLNFRSENVILNIENGTINAGVYNLILYNSTDAFSRKIVILK